MTSEERKDYTYHKIQLNNILEEEIKGHQIRTRGLPKYEINEPDISTYSNFEKIYKAKNIIYQLKDEKGITQTSNPKLLLVAEKYYTKLFSKTKTCSKTREKLLRNVRAKLNVTDQIALNANLELIDLEKALSHPQMARVQAPTESP